MNFLLRIIRRVIGCRRLARRRRAVEQGSVEALKACHPRRLEFVADKDKAIVQTPGGRELVGIVHRAAVYRFDGATIYSFDELDRLHVVTLLMHLHLAHAKSKHPNPRRA